MDTSAPPILLLSGPEHHPDLPAGWLLVTGVLDCLHRAVSGLARGVVADLRSSGPDGMQDQLTLLRLLGENPYTRTLPRAALLPGVLREVLEDLANAGVETVHLPGAASGLPPQVLDAPFVGPWPADFLRTTCPFFNSRPAGRGWLHSCGAYRNRLVLGGRRMAVYCLGGGFRDCSYFNAPRPSELQGAEP